ncbi:MAG TPA: hydrolase 1, exosortase A system-associated [Novosphingobium sp.]|nr:hydrolase 1, exosortase A system-associated [Novosphingobium sp.]
MSRRLVTFTCEGAQMAGTLDEGAASSGLLLVSGGSEIRSGAWAGQARLAATIAAQGFAVFRFDRRGVGDSEGADFAFRSSAPDIAAALSAFRHKCPQLTRVVALGNCDAASALMLASGAGCDALVLSNPWTIEDEAAPAPPAAVRDHYRRRLSDPRAILRLLSGKVSPAKLLASLRDALKPAPPATGLAVEMASALRGFPGEVRFLLAARDRTAQAFLAAWNGKDPRLHTCADASHSFVEPHARDWYAAQVLDMLRG